MCRSCCSPRVHVLQRRSWRLVRRCVAPRAIHWPNTHCCPGPRALCCPCMAWRAKVSHHFFWWCVFSSPRHHPHPFFISFPYFIGVIVLFFFFFFLPSPSLWDIYFSPLFREGVVLFVFCQVLHCGLFIYVTYPALTNTFARPVTLIFLMLFSHANL